MPELMQNGRTISLNEADSALTLRCGETIFRFAGNGCKIEALRREEGKFRFRLRTPRLSFPLEATLRFADDGNPELRLAGDGALTAPVEYPGSLIPDPGDLALIPAGEGFAFPVDDPSIPVLPECSLLNSQSWHLAFLASLRGDAWIVLAVESGTDAQVRHEREGGLLHSQLGWLPEGGVWGYERAVRFLSGDRGGLSALCAAYRRYRDAPGPVESLREKRWRLPQLDRLIGAPEFWIWPDQYEEFMYGAGDAELNPTAVELVRIAGEIKAAGCDRALIGLFFAGDCPAAGKIAEKTGFLTAKYDNLEDELPGTLAPLIPPARLRECDYTARRMTAWPRDTVRDEAGNYIQAWALRGRDGIMHHQNRVCPQFAPEYTRAEVPALAREHGFEAWFFDVMGGGAMECRAPEHPLTRRESIRKRREAFQILGDAGLISGTEEGCESYVGACCYSEGKLSPALYRLNYRESGRSKAHQYTPEEHEEIFDRFMLNPRYRIPLWELIYHDCMVSYWYWGDSSNCCPELLPRRDLFNLLYGQPPLYSLHVADWKRQKPLLLESAKRASAAARLTGYEKMTAFDWLDAEKLVHRTRFANGVTVTVNFSDRAFRTDSGETVPPCDFLLERGNLSETEINPL